MKIARKKHILLSAFLILFVAGVFIWRGTETQKESAKKEITLAVSTVGKTHDWAKDVMESAQDELKKVAERQGWNVICVSAEDTYQQSQQVTELVEQQVDGIILLPMDGASLKTAAITVQRAGIPLVIFDREIPEFAPTSTVKGDNRGIGVETAKYLNDYFPHGTTVLELMGDTSTVPFQRTDGFDNTLNSNFQKIQVGYTEWQREYTREMFEQWIEQQKPEVLAEVGAIFTHDDEIALGVLDVLDQYEAENRRDMLFPNLKVIAGSSSNQKMYQRIKEEEHYELFSMTYDFEMMRQAVRRGEEILSGEEYEEMTIIPTVRVDKDNVDDYLEK